MKLLNKYLFAILTIAVIGLKGVTYNINIPNRTLSNKASMAYLEIQDMYAKRASIYVFLKSHNSPLVREAGTFARVAHENELDWTLLVSISGMESTFGKNVPRGSYNPFGWGGGNIIYFNSWKDAIEAVGEGLADYKIKYGVYTVEQIAPIYCPPNYKRWIYGVNYFSSKLEDIYNNSYSPIAMEY